MLGVILGCVIGLWICVALSGFSVLLMLHETWSTNLELSRLSRQSHDTQAEVLRLAIDVSKLREDVLGDGDDDDLDELDLDLEDDDIDDVILFPDDEDDDEAEIDLYARR